MRSSDVSGAVSYSRIRRRGPEGPNEKHTPPSPSRNRPMSPTDRPDTTPAQPPSDAAPDAGLSHVTDRGAGPESRMVDVGAKAPTRREARARAQVRFPSGALATVLRGEGPKGPVTEIARAAGVLAAKRTAEWIPMCHVLPLDGVDVTFERPEEDVLEVRTRVACTGRTGVEMEALVAASAAALTVYDMTKALDKGIVIERVELLEKSGGASGTWRRP